jgi:pimeloyl-ACP methyl ester carboxylesterase
VQLAKFRYQLNRWHSSISYNGDVQASSLFLYNERIKSNVDGQQEPGTTVFLHGLLGSGRNLRTLAQKMCAINKNQGVLVDLAGHGKSLTTKRSRPATFSLFVADLKHTLSSILPSSVPDTETVNSSSHPWSFVGHSLGGRIALQYTYESLISMRNSQEGSKTRPWPIPASVWLLDTVPGSPDPVVASIVNTLVGIQAETLKNRISRLDLVETLHATHNIDLGMAQWLGSSFDPTTGRFMFDLDVAQQLLSDFDRQDWLRSIKDILEIGADIHIDIVRGGQNKQWEKAQEKHGSLDAVLDLVDQYPSRCHFHVLPDAGHWVHVDDLPGLLAVYRKRASVI